MPGKDLKVKEFNKAKRTIKLIIISKNIFKLFNLFNPMFIYNIISIF